MKKFIYAIWSCLGLLLNYGCSKQQCADPLALNFNTFGEDCMYDSYKYIGTYTASDSVIDNYYYWMTHSRVNYSFTVEKLKGDSLAIRSFFNCSEPLKFKIDSTSIIIRDNDFCDRQMHGYFDFISDTIRYNCWYSNSAGTIRRWGEAIKID